MKSRSFSETTSSIPHKRRRRHRNSERFTTRAPLMGFARQSRFVLSLIQRLSERAKSNLKNSVFHFAARSRKRLGSGVQPASSTATPSCMLREASPLHSFGKNGLDSHLLEREALRGGLPTVRLTPTIFFLAGDYGKVGFSCTASSGTGRVASKIAGQKQLARTVLARAGIPVPKGQKFPIGAQRRALQFATKLGWPVVVKPAAGWGGAGVTTNIRNERELLQAIQPLHYTSHIIVEEYFEGRDYRFLVLEDRVLSVILRDPANVIGDGQHTIIQLVATKNSVRQKNPHLKNRLIKMDESARTELKRQRLTPESIPAAGQRVSLSSAGNLSQGGDSCEVLDETHASLKQMAVRALNAVPGLFHAGIDILIPDHRLALDVQKVGICEINSVPAISGHHFPLVGPSRNVSREIVDFYCSRTGIPMHSPVETLTLQLTVTGRVQNTGYRRWMAGLANELGVVGWVKNEDDGTVRAIASGPTDLVAILASLAINGPRKAHVEMVETAHVFAEAGSNFRIIRRAGSAQANTEQTILS
jgi:D-alanine-D-alanine ligase-like ATP-grasp enzyme/acylphosphatase